MPASLARQRRPAREVLAPLIHQDAVRVELRLRGFVHRRLHAVRGGRGRVRRVGAHSAAHSASARGFAPLAHSAAARRRARLPELRVPRVRLGPHVQLVQHRHRHRGLAPPHRAIAASNATRCATVGAPPRLPALNAVVGTSAARPRSPLIRWDPDPDPDSDPDPIPPRPAAAVARLDASTASGQSSIAPAASARPSCAIASRAYIGTDASPGRSARPCPTSSPARRPRAPAPRRPRRRPSRRPPSAAGSRRAVRARGEPQGDGFIGQGRAASAAAAARRTDSSQASTAISESGSAVASLASESASRAEGVHVRGSRVATRGRGDAEAQERHRGGHRQSRAAGQARGSSRGEPSLRVEASPIASKSGADSPNA